ncbi:MAG: hypothetical protein Q4C47_07660, partial [Planctomycetia bacterium]|nr:hypothetical protein [Planctomycetia bacterium]
SEDTCAPGAEVVTGCRITMDSVTIDEPVAEEEMVNEDAVTRSTRSVGVPEIRRSASPGELHTTGYEEPGKRSLRGAGSEPEPSAMASVGAERTSRRQLAVERFRSRAIFSQLRRRFPKQ